MKKRIIFLLIVLSYFSCNNSKEKDDVTIDPRMQKVILQSAKSYFTPLPELNLQNLPIEKKKQIEIGKKLYYDNKLSKKENKNCASCHIISKNNYGVDNLRVSPGDNDQTGHRNTPTVLNAHLQFAQFWDAHEFTVEEQAVGPMFGDFEMNMPDTLELLRRIKSDEYYAKQFPLAFPDSTDAITIETIKDAIGAFERTLLTPAPIDDYLKGDTNAISNRAKLGIKSFIDNGCIPCHSTTLVGGAMTQKFSIFGYYWDYTNSDYIDKGRYDFTLDPKDKFVFKVPMLRNIEKTFPYMHDGSVKTMNEAIKIMALAETNISISDEDAKNIEEFFKTLTGEVPDHAIEDNPIFE